MAGDDAFALEQPTPCAWCARGGNPQTTPTTPEESIILASLVEGGQARHSKPGDIEPWPVVACRFFKCEGFDRERAEREARKLWGDSFHIIEYPESLMAHKCDPPEFVACGPSLYDEGPTIRTMTAPEKPPTVRDLQPVTPKIARRAIWVTPDTTPWTKDPAAVEHFKRLAGVANGSTDWLELFDWSCRDEPKPKPNAEPRPWWGQLLWG